MATVLKKLNFYNEKKIRKIMLQIINKVSSNDKIKKHIQSTMALCLKVMETDNEQCVYYCVLIFKELLTHFKPKYDSCFNIEVIKFFKFIVEMYNNSCTQEKIFNVQKSPDVDKALTTIRVITNVSKNSVNYVVVPMGKLSFKVLKELAHILKLYYVLYGGIQSFINEIIEFIPILMKFFNLDIPYKADYRDIVLDLKHAQVRLLFFFAFIIKENKSGIRGQCTLLPGRVIGLLNCNLSSDVSNIRTELLSGFESVILIDYKYEFLPFMDKFLDEILITGRCWSLKQVLRPKAYIYIDHLITHLHSQLSLNFLVRVIHLHFCNLLDPALQTDVQINLCHMVMNVLSYIVQRQNQLITNLNAMVKEKNPLIDLFHRVFQIYVIKLKQFQKSYLPQFDEQSISQEPTSESISSVLEETQKEKLDEFMYASEITPYSIADSRRFITIIIPAIRTLFQFIVKIDGSKFSVEHYYKKSFKILIKYSLLSLKVFHCQIKKKEMVKELLNALSCVHPTHLKTLLIENNIVQKVYANNIETIVFDIALNDEELFLTFSCLIFEYILNNLENENERQHLYDLVDKLHSSFKKNKNKEIASEYVYKVIKKLLHILKNTKYTYFYLGILKSILMIIESTTYEYDENMNSVITSLFNDLFSYHKTLPDHLIVTNTSLVELCLAECVFKVTLHSHLMDMLKLVVYSLQRPELTPQGLGILEKCIVNHPNIFCDDLFVQVRIDLVKGLYHCLNSPLEIISEPAMSLLGKFGGLNRSAVIKSYHLNAQKEFHHTSKKPKIFLSFENYTNYLLELDIGPGVNAAVQTLISESDKFIREHSWNIIKGFLTLTMEYDAGFLQKLLSNINWDTYKGTYPNKDSKNIKTVTDGTCIKALTGLMICCCDEHLKEDAYKYYNRFIKQFVHISIYHFTDISCGRFLKANPYILIEAIYVILSNEMEIISDFGILATELVVKELHVILEHNMLNFPIIANMYNQFCEYCYDSNWIRKRGGCYGLYILFSNVIKFQNSGKNEYSNWFIENYLTAIRAMLFIFSDFNGNLTFGALKIAERNLDAMLNWLYSMKSTNLSHNSIQKTILKELIGNIFGPNDLLREQSIKMITLMAETEQKSVLQILKPYFKYFKAAIPGSKLFSTYTFKSQMGIMKGHIFCSLHSIPAEKLDLSKSEHKYYFDVLCTVSQGCTDKLFRYITSNELFEFRQTAIKVLVNCLSFLGHRKKIKVLRILLNQLQSPDIIIQELVYQGLKSLSSKTLLKLKMVDKLLSYYADLFQDPDKMTLVDIRFVLYLIKLFPSHPNIIFCTLLLNAFKYLWGNLKCYNNKMPGDHVAILENLLESISLAENSQFIHIEDICKIILNVGILDTDLFNRINPLLTECLLKYPDDTVVLFFQENHIKNKIWCSFFNLMILNKKCESLRNVLTSNCLRLENLLISSRIDPSRCVQYECIKFIFNLVRMDKKCFASAKKITTILLNIWSNAQYKERYKNLASIKLTEWDEPKMLLKIVLAYYKYNLDEVYILFQILPVFSHRLPVDVLFFRKFLKDDIVESCTIEWRRMVFFKFMDLYNKKTVNSDILGKILQYVILPCFSMSYKKGQKNELLCARARADENVIATVLSKLFANIRLVLSGCDFDGIKVLLCQLIYIMIEDLLNFNANIGDLIYNALISCIWTNKCPMDVNVKYHCYLILTCVMLSENTSKRDKLNQGIYYELLKASFTEAQPVINYSLHLIVTAVHGDPKEINALVSSVRKLLIAENQNIPILHHLCLFLIKYNKLFYPYKQFLLRHVIGSLYPIAKNNNVPEFKKTAIELACMTIKWELSSNDNHEKVKNPQKRKHECNQSVTGENSTTIGKKSSDTIDNCMNFLAMVGCQTHDDKLESRISKLAIRSATLFKNILATEPIDRTLIKLKFGWIEKHLDVFIKKEFHLKENPNGPGNTNASVMNILTTFDIFSFMLDILCPKIMLETLIPLQNILIQFFQLSIDEERQNFFNHNHKDMIMSHQLTALQVKQYCDATLKLFIKILNTFPSNVELKSLHEYINTVTFDGLKSNNPHNLDVSLSLLKVSLVHFPKYMTNEIINIMGDILFKYNENNENPSIKVKCLEILKTHVDTLTRAGREIFVENVVMVNLDKARDVENHIPFEVQIKCFELVITYIKDISEASERTLLNSTILGYIKTTTDERIMTIILNLFEKWIEICRDQQVYFNCQVIKMIKSIAVLNRFPKLTEYCYKLNFEIYKNWVLTECIEFGFDCKTPSIRSEFLNSYNTLWDDTGLCMRLYTIMTDKMSYNLENSLAFYIQFLFVKISKDTKLQGDFPFLDINKLSDFNEAMTVSDGSLNLQPVQSFLTFDMCSSLAQLCFVNENLAKHLWISLLPSIWSLFSENQRKILSEKAVHCLANSKLKQNFMNVFYEAIVHCKPKINFEPLQMVNIGRKYNLWYLVIEQMEDICNHFEHEKKNDAVEGLVQMYSLLREEDVLESIFQTVIKCDDAKKAFSLEQQGCVGEASQMYNVLLHREKDKGKLDQANCLNKHSEFLNIRYTKCLRELGDWNFLSENNFGESNFVLNIEHRWKNLTEDSTSSNRLRWELQHKQNIWPSKLIWKYHFYLAMLGLNELDPQCMEIVQEQVKLGAKEIINQWKLLPKYLCEAHIPLLQSTQLLVEVQEANYTHKSCLQMPQNINNNHKLIDTWTNRKPWIGDNLVFWNDLISSRQIYYSFLKEMNSNSEINHIKNAQEQSSLLFGEIALKQNMFDVCMKTLKKLNPENICTSNWLHTMHLEAKCLEKVCKYTKNFNNITSPLKKDVHGDIRSLFLAIRGSFYNSCGHSNVAFKYLITAFMNEKNKTCAEINWQCVVDDSFNSLIENKKNKTSDNNKTPSDDVSKTLKSNEILENAWFQLAKLIETNFCNSFIKDITVGVAAMKCYIIASKFTNKMNRDMIAARMLWLLLNDDGENTLLKTFKKCDVEFSDTWFPQILNILIEKEKSVIEKIMPKIVHLYPQKMYLILNRMLMVEKENLTIKMDTYSPVNKNNTQPIETKIIKLKYMMNSLKKNNVDVIQLNYFVDQMNALGESWDEELYRNLYECLYLCYEYAFENKTLSMHVPSEISNCINKIKNSFISQDVNEGQFKKKKTFLVPDNLSACHQEMKQKFSVDFSLTSESTIKMVAIQLKIWIENLEKKSAYPSKFVHEFRCPTIHKFDWSVIRLPSDYYINDSSKAVRIHNFSGHVYLKDNSGSVVKQISIRGTDGSLYYYNISRGRAIESEERVSQLFRLVNNFLLDFKETTKRFLKMSLTKSFIISPHLRMIETNNSTISLLEVYKKMSVNNWIHGDIDFWFSALHSSVTMQRPNPLIESFISVQHIYCSDQMMINWVLSRFPSQSDYWTFRKNFIEHYSVLCFLEYAFNLTKLKPEMLNIDENSGAAVALHYRFFLSEVHGHLARTNSLPFRMTPNLVNFITPYRKYQMINSLTATAKCLNSNIEDIRAILRLLLKDEFNDRNNIKNNQELLDDGERIYEIVETNLNYILKNFDDLKNLSTNNQIPKLLQEALAKDKICHGSPTWRPWL